MKKYVYCFLLIIAACIICIGAGYWFTRSSVRQEPAIPNVTVETETVPEDGMAFETDDTEARPAAGQEPAKYCLTAKDGYLLVFGQDRETVYMDPHMPLKDFPPEEQSKLLQGIWFSNMMDIFSYLESYTS